VVGRDVREAMGCTSGMPPARTAFQEPGDSCTALPEGSSQRALMHWPAHKAGLLAMACQGWSVSKCTLTVLPARRLPRSGRFVSSSRHAMSGGAVVRFIQPWDAGSGHSRTRPVPVTRSSKASCCASSARKPAACRDAAGPECAGGEERLKPRSRAEVGEHMLFILPLLTCWTADGFDPVRPGRT
jgi:hypothetical protein